MKLFTRVAFMLALVIALLVPMTASAQEMPCYGLSSGDCELFYQPNTTMGDVKSFTMQYTFNLNVPETFELSSDGGGNLSEVAGVEDPFKAFNMDMVVNGSMNDLTSGESGAGSIEFRIIDGMFYLNLAGIPDVEESMKGWIGFMLEPFLTAMMEQFSAMGVPMDLESLMSGEAAGMADMGEMDMSAFEDLFNKYITVTRGADIDVAGNAVAVFTMNLDLAGVFADPGLTEAVNQWTTMVGEMAGDQMTEEDLQSLQMTGAMLPMLGMFFANTTFTLTEHVGVNDGYMYGFGFDLNMTLDPTMMAGMMGGEVDAEAEPVTIVLNFMVELTNHNSEFTFTAPETFTEISPEEMMSGGF